LATGDVENVMRIFSDPKAMRFAPVPVTEDRSMAKRFIEWSQRNYGDHGCGAYAVIGREGERYIGHAGLIPHEIGLEVFYALASDCWGQGLGTEVAHACRDFAFQKLRRDRLIAIIHPDNAAAIAVATKIGMHEDGEITFWNRVNRLFALHAAQIVAAIDSPAR
jgi:RimJ/RimL family protein N-acetyltransferase